jgi:hypothetical protein
VLTENFELKAEETTAKAFQINSGKLKPGNHTFILLLSNQNGRQDREVVRVKLQKDTTPQQGTGGLQNVTCSGDTVNIKVWDHGTQDGDVVSVSLGGAPVLSDFDLNSCGGKEPGVLPCAFMNLPFPAGTQVAVTIRALNEGSVSPNTASLKVEGGCTPEVQQWGLKTGDTASIFISRSTASQGPGQAGAQSPGTLTAPQSWP